MAPPSTIRFMFPTMVHPVLAPVADAAFLYLRAMARARLPLVAMSTSGFTHVDTSSRWHPYRNLFSGKVLDEKFVNLCVGVGNDFDRLWTLNQPNVMITGPWLKEPDSPKVLEMRRRWHLIENPPHEPTEESVKKLIADAWALFEKEPNPT